MKALTLIEPWAALIAHGLKSYETRSWQTGYRGLIAIHAGKTKDEAYIESLLVALANGEIDTRVANAIRDMHCGEVVALAWLADCRPTREIKPDWSWGEQGPEERNPRWTMPMADGSIPDPPPISEMERWAGDFGRGRYAWELQLIKGVRNFNSVPCRGMPGLFRIPDHAWPAVLRQVPK